MTTKDAMIVQLHDKNSEMVVGNVIINRHNFDDLCTAWDLYQQTYNSNNEKEPDIFEFEQQYGEDIGFETIEISFYQP